MKISILSLLLSIFLLIGCSKDELINETENPTSGNPVIQQTFDGQILSSFHTMDIFKIIKKDDGFIFFTRELISETPHNTGIRIFKTDYQLNLIWTFLINNSDNQSFAGVLELSNNEYIAILSKFSYTNSGLGDYEVYGLKFNDSGTILWEKNYSMNNVDANTHLDGTINFTNKSNDLKVMFRSDSTYYNSDDFYYREVKLNSEGDILENNKISPSSPTQFYNIIYDNIGNKYNFGGTNVVDLSTSNGDYITFNASITKYNSNNIQLFNNLYGFPFVEDYFYKANINNNNNNITLIGKSGVLGDVNQRTRWIVQFDAFGNIIWEIKESSQLTEYVGRDIIQDDDGNHLSLFEDFYGTNVATLIKSNNQGEILWKFTDGEINNNDTFSPRKIMKNGNEYMIFGEKDNKLWLKKITVN